MRRRYQDWLELTRTLLSEILEFWYLIEKLLSWRCLSSNKTIKVVYATDRKKVWTSSNTDGTSANTLVSSKGGKHLINCLVVQYSHLFKNWCIRIFYIQVFFYRYNAQVPSVDCCVFTKKLSSLQIKFTTLT